MQSLLEPPADFYCAKLKKASKKLGTDEVCLLLLLLFFQKHLLLYLFVGAAQKHTPQERCPARQFSHFQVEWLLLLLPLLSLCVHAFAYVEGRT